MLSPRPYVNPDVTLFQYKASMDEAHADSEKKRQTHRRLEDEFTQYKKTSEREIARAKQGSTAAGAATQREEALQDEVKQLMVYCSAFFVLGDVG